MEGEDDLKKKQLMELAIINGTYRDNSNGKANGMSGRLQIAPVLQPNAPAFRLPNMSALPMGVGLVNPSSMLRPVIKFKKLHIQYIHMMYIKTLC